MSEYQIHQWNQIIDSTNVLRPIFTFVPDAQFLDYILNNPGTILLQISGTGIYDGKQYATCTSSYDFPNFGPTYFQTTKQYVIVLHTSFVTYPFQNGSFIISTNIRSPQDINTLTQPWDNQAQNFQLYNVPILQQDPLIHEYFEDDKPESHMIRNTTIILCLLILILLYLLYIM